MAISFNEKIRSRIFGNSSYVSTSGSEHDAESDVVSPSPCLSHLVLNFLEDDSTATTTSDSSRFHYYSDSDSDDDVSSSHSKSTPSIDSFLDPTVRNNADPFVNQLFLHVVRASEIFTVFRKNKSVFNRNLMAYLREIGYNAGVCKTKWSSSGGLTAGCYEFIDVISPAEEKRYLVDGDFAGEFEIARETENFAKLRRSLPRVFVGKSEDLKKIVRLMCDEARKSMKINGLSLPPWRKNRYMQMKWLGQYRRSVNHFPAMTSSSSNDFAVKCRAVGFDVAGDGGRFYMPPATRTR